MSKINEVAELVEKGKAKLVGPAVQEAIDEGDDPVAILNDGMISAMSVVGEKFKNGEIFVPEMLVAARAMKKGVEVLKPHLAQICYKTDEAIKYKFLKDLTIVSNGKTYKNINKSARVKKLEKKLRREQRCLSRKYENLKKGESTQKNIQKQKLKVQRLHHKIDNIRTDYINKSIAEIVKTKPSYITIEDLNVSGMMKNRHLSKAVASQKFYEFRTKLKAKCDENGIELRVVDRWYPSSKICHCCGAIKKDLKLSDRIYRCDCGYVEDRDFNAALNLRNALTYEVAQ